MHRTHRAYLPAAGKDWALPLYDPMVKLLGGEAVRLALLELAALRGHERVLDIGCGTGTLVTLVKRAYEGTKVVGLDPDRKALARARSKAVRAGVSIELDQAFSDELPYPDASFDRVLSSLMFHHLEASSKEKTLREVRRVLKPGGSLHLADFAQPEGRLRGLSRMIHASHHLRDNSDGGILALLSQAGFAQPKKTREGTMMFGLLRIAYYTGVA